MSQQLPPRKNAPWMIAPCNAPWMIDLRVLPPGELLPGINVPEENCLPADLSPIDKWLRGKLSPKKILPLINYAQYKFPQESEIVVV